MTYKKPEISVLGDAASVIQILGKPYGTMWDGLGRPADVDPAYDLDE